MYIYTCIKEYKMGKMFLRNPLTYPSEKLKYLKKKNSKVY